MGWVAGTWTRIFPVADWSFHLLTMTNSALALWSVDLISRRFVRGDKRVVVLLLLMLLPAYQFHAQRFNANSVLLAIWPLATYCFLRSFETRQPAWAAAAGATAAIALLGKYYSIFLIGSFVCSAILHPHRRIYFASSAPWVCSIAGVVTLGPHLYWLATTGAQPLAYALAAQGGVAFSLSLIEAVFFLLGLAAAVVIPAVTWIMIAGHRLLRFSEDFKTMNAGLLLLFFISVGTLALPVVTAVTLGTHLPSLWALQGLFIFAILIVCGASYRIERFYSVNLTVLVTGIALIAVTMAAPIHAMYRNNYPFEEGRNFYRLAALELTRQWHDLSDEPLSAVGGDDALAFATAFYSTDHPIYTRAFKDHHPGELQRQTTLERGWAALCFAEQLNCIEWLVKNAPPALQNVRSDFVVRSSLLGKPGATRGVTALIVPPQISDITTP